MITFYSANSFGGYSVQLAEGEYCTGELSVYGLADKDIASFKMLPGYKLRRLHLMCASAIGDMT